MFHVKRSASTLRDGVDCFGRTILVRGLMKKRLVSRETKRASREGPRPPRGGSDWPMFHVKLFKNEDIIWVLRGF